ncbi:MAG: phytase [Calditrichia bacterium]|nr:phytase [Calditrichia bacterium]
MMMIKFVFPWLIGFALVAATALAQSVTPKLELQAGGVDDQDDMCIWLHPGDLSQSTIITSDKGANKLFVYDLSGNSIQSVATPGQPGNIDIRYNFILSGQPIDIVGFNDRSNERIVLYKVDHATRQLSMVGNFDAGNWPSELYGFCLYRSPNTGKYYAFGSATNSQMRQWELVDNGDGTIGGIEKRTWFNAPDGQTEGNVADDETGKLYAASEKYGVYKYDADPNDPNPVGELIAPVGSHGLTEDVEGVTIYYAANGEGYLIVSSQGSGDFKVYERKPPHNFVKTFEVVNSDDTDGIDVINVNLGPEFPAGIFTAHTDRGSRPVLVCDYQDLGLLIDTGYWNPRNNGGTSSLFGNVAVPREFSLEQNYPNPFNPGTAIRYTLPNAANIRLAVYDLAGREVAVLAEGFYSAGSYAQDWQALDHRGGVLPSGIYFARLQVAPEEAGGYSTAIKMVLSR